MPIEITMPKLSDTMEEGTILQWRVKEGDNVKKGQIIAEVETDKAAMEMEAFDDGVVSSLKVEEGATVPVGAVIAVFDAEGKAAAVPEAARKPAEEPVEKPGTKPDVKPAEKPEEEQVKAEEKPEEKEEEIPEEKPEEKAEEKAEKKADKRPTPPSEQGVSASPVARKLAMDKGLDLGRIRGTGPGGRIVLTDVERTSPEKAPAPAEVTWRPERTAGKSVKIRRIVARKMLESWQTIPHFFVTVAVDMTDVIRFRKDLDVSINDFILAATTRSLHEHPWVNSHWIDGEAAEQESISIAMAVATDRGLYNPVIRDCGKLSLKEINRRARDLVDKAHLGKLVQDDLEGGTFTISNMGMLGVESFSAIITPPQVAVLAVGTVKGEVVVDEQGEPGIAPILRLTLSADHRTLDGADAAEFLATLKSYLEAPVTLVTCHYGAEEE